MSGLYADIDGPAGAEAIKMAIADFGGTVNGKKIEVLVRRPPEQGRRRRRQGARMVRHAGRRHADRRHQLGHRLAMAKVAAEKKKPFISIGAAGLGADQRGVHALHRALRLRHVALAKGTGSAVVKAGGKSWYFLTADYAFGHSLENDTADVVKANGGTVVGSVRHPLSAQRLLVVPAAGAVLQGADPRPGQRRRRHHQRDQGGQRVRHHQDDEARRPAGVHQRRPRAGPARRPQGMYLTDSWYWDQDAERAESQALLREDQAHAVDRCRPADYSAAMTYLKAVKAAGSDDADKVHGADEDDEDQRLLRQGRQIRADGRMIHDMYLMQVKTPDESNEPWDYYKSCRGPQGRRRPSRPWPRASARLWK